MALYFLLGIWNPKAGPKRAPSRSLGAIAAILLKSRNRMDSQNII